MQLIINGQKRDFDSSLNILELLAELSIDTKKVAVELNRNIVPKSQYEQTALNDNDALEIVHFIGGG